ncbi:MULTISPECIES: PepSY domain-containing protein [unclassified Bosea (in: a-proteobacteria)]|uniref:PepSY domain-containing protein n=1 Tax=unclassified Bosea (in: a-proteobacteria) TaxID=2653178 RepID=UPI000F74D32E|nr:MULTISPECIES: PepSY domain-containing protein [unclassified Bosea (in: a-proteobacteria)]AZO79499.1 hypothetical protein BLM15_19265 [Bosea sp. Tri-49]RXT16258.1 hypothetical protein B5U98_30140 [Bosea sp. Tri-39]RXT39951.1 hypothetical protein B5U99_07185 [Bosea sp. Tri-54]
MLTRRFVLTACLGLVPAGSAFAQALSGSAVAPPVDIPAPGAPMAPPYPPRPPAPAYDDDDEDYGISRREAVRIARRSGVVDVENVRRRRGVWIVSGTDGDDEDIRVVINDEGDVVAVRRD